MRTASDSAGARGALGPLPPASGGSKAGRVLCKGKPRASPRLRFCGTGSFAFSFNPAGRWSLPCNEPSLKPALAAAAAPPAPAGSWAVPALPVPPGARRPPGASGAPGAPLSGAPGPRRREWSLAARVAALLLGSAPSCALSGAPWSEFPAVPERVGAGGLPAGSRRAPAVRR